jgi:alginate O-acetyltransferase complex protein AlgI
VLFNSLTFVVFFIIVLALYYLPYSWTLKKWMLLLASYIFYAAWNPPLIVLLWISTLIDWFGGGFIARSNNQAVRRFWLVVSILANIGMLAFFKYGGFVLESFTAIVNSYGIAYNPAKPDIILPMGISFYTFQTLTYTVDIWRRQLSPARTFLDYALYVTFFPQLVAGPILRAIDFLPQCDRQPRVTPAMFQWGLCLMTLGLFQKVVLADTLLAKPADDVFGFAGPVSALDAWTGVLAFTGQIFCDFAGYSTCAIGTAMCMGFWLPGNFRFPYAAIGFSDFWRRWHITLSTWLRDYLYIPLGGNRKGPVRTTINLMLTMLIGGLWHGAAWTFVAWGGLHGLFLVVERMLRARFGEAAWTRTRAAEVLFVAVTFFLVCLSWVFFRAKTFAQAGTLFTSLFGLAREGAQVLPTFDLLAVGVVIGAILIAHWLLRHSTHETLVAKTPWWLAATVWAAMLVTIILTQGSGDAFIYFQF